MYCAGFLPYNQLVGLHLELKWKVQKRLMLSKTLCMKKDCIDYFCMAYCYDVFSYISVSVSYTGAWRLHNVLYSGISRNLDLLPQLTQQQHFLTIFPCLQGFQSRSRMAAYSIQTQTNCTILWEHRLGGVKSHVSISSSKWVSSYSRYRILPIPSKWLSRPYKCN